MAGDPLSSAVSEGNNPYGTPPAEAILNSLFKGAHPAVLAEVTRTFLERLTLLEMYLEQELKLEIDSSGLEKFRESHLPDLNREAAKMAQLFYGRVATREGG